jgi:hypothetical protein
LTTDWNSLFEYRDGALYHKVSRVGCRKGDRVGSLRGDGYWKLGVMRKEYRVHRVIYEMHHGPIPEGMDIDHIDRNRSNNRIENLRVVTRSQNIENKNTRGCYYQKERNKWSASIKVNGKRKFLGRYDTEQEAHQVYVEAKEKYHGVYL